ncbi:transposase [Legionella sp. 227]|uniref:REP-associated tyrosine transposase n=1 Tax=Legionella sp. 227 TaxID=3367288 RepID=UPI00370D171E
MYYRRVFRPGSTYFFTLNLKDRASNLLVQNIHVLRKTMSQIKKRYPFEINGIVILPEHLHMMISLPKGDSDYPLRIRLIKSNFSRQLPCNESIRFARQRKKERGIWQRRYWEHCIRDEKDYERHLNYIHYNPVKHGYVKKASDWHYSSIHRYIDAEILCKEWGGCSDKDRGFGE